MDAMQIKNGILAAMAAMGVLIANALGGWDNIMALLVALMVLDYLTGVMLAAFWKRSPKSETGTLNSMAGFRGLIKKGMILLVVRVAVLLDEALGIDYVRLMAILFFTGNEGLSLLENLGLMGVPWPKFLRDMLEALREHGDAGKDKAGGSETHPYMEPWEHGEGKE